MLTALWMMFLLGDSSRQLGSVIALVFTLIHKKCEKKVN